MDYHDLEREYLLTTSDDSTALQNIEIPSVDELVPEPSSNVFVPEPSINVFESEAPIDLALPVSASDSLVSKPFAKVVNRRLIFDSGVSGPSVDVAVPVRAADSISKPSAKVPKRKRVVNVTYLVLQSKLLLFTHINLVRKGKLQLIARTLLIGTGKKFLIKDPIQSLRSSSIVVMLVRVLLPMTRWRVHLIFTHSLLLMSYLT